MHAVLVLSPLAATHPVLEANVSRLEHNRQPVLTKINGVEEPTPADAVALYLSGEADLTESVPLKYKWLAASKGYLETGSGNARSAIPLCPHAKIPAFSPPSTSCISLHELRGSLP